MEQKRVIVFSDKTELAIPDAGCGLIQYIDTEAEQAPRSKVGKKVPGNAGGPAANPTPESVAASLDAFYGAVRE